MDLLNLRPSYIVRSCLGGEGKRREGKGEEKKEKKKINLFFSVHSMITIEYSIHDGHLIFS